MKKITKIKILIVIFIMLTLLLISLCVGLFFFNFLQEAPSDDMSLYPFTISSGETASEIGTRLENEGFIKKALFFRFVVKQENLILQAGEYNLPKNLPLKDLALELTHGTFDTRITILEGWRREEIADYLFENSLLPEISNEGKSIFELRQEIIDKIKEGYFFPETYHLSKDSSLTELVAIAKELFDTQVDASMLTAYASQNLTLDEAVIVASIVEREAMTDESRTLVAGILLKRLENDWPLEADATVQYAMADRDCVNTETCSWWAKDIYEEDLNIDSFFNTRKYPGLPPEAICNPSLSSLQAVASPTESEYWFYLTGSDGNMYYAKTLEEHNQNIANYL